jgi:hypothetical protein
MRESPPPVANVSVVGLTANAHICKQKLTLAFQTAFVEKKSLFSGDSSTKTQLANLLAAIKQNIQRGQQGN